MCRIQHKQAKQEKNNYIKIKKSHAVRIEPELILSDEESQTAGIKKGASMMIDKRWLYLTPTHDYAILILSPGSTLTFSSVWSK